MAQNSPGSAFRKALEQSSPLQIVGTINAYCAMMAEQVGFAALYVSGAGVANASYGMPDLGVTQLPDVLTDVSRITAATDLPVLVDADTGWGNELGIARTVREMVRAEAAGLHIEDQVPSKRCGHRPDKTLVSEAEMIARIKAAVDARTDPEFVIMARTDAVANEGVNAAIDRINAYTQAGADMVFPEAITELADYQKIAAACKTPILANITEFGKTPLFTRDQLADAGVAMILYPLSAFRAMNAAALNVYQTIHEKGTQASVLASMQTREALYDFLDYHAFEAKTNN